MDAQESETVITDAATHAGPGAFPPGGPQQQIERRLTRPDPSRKRQLASILIVIILLAAGIASMVLLQNDGDDTMEPVTIQDIFAIRGLEVLGEVPYRYMGEAELAGMLEESLNPAELEEMRLAFDALFLMDYSEDLESQYLDAYASQVMGFYDFEAKEMVLVDHQLSDTVERVTLSHELTHALQDQHFDLTRLLDVGTSDQVLARQSLVEGDAMTVMAFYFLTLPQDQRQEFLGEMESLSAASPGIPYAIEQTMIFPYLRGTQFVMELYLDGGWSAVNTAYVRPPCSTEQVLHPGKYRVDERPVKVTLDLAPPGLDLAFEDTLGEFMTSAMLGHYLPNATASAAAEGWGGDIFKYYGNGTHFLSALKTVWDTEQDAVEFQLAYEEFLSSLPEIYGHSVDSGCVQVSRQGDVTTIYHASHTSYMSGISA